LSKRKGIFGKIFKLKKVRRDGLKGLRREGSLVGKVRGVLREVFEVIHCEIVGKVRLMFDREFDEVL
jgi:hypothetical protein